MIKSVFAFEIKKHANQKYLSENWLLNKKKYS